MHRVRGSMAPETSGPDTSTFDFQLPNNENEAVKRGVEILRKLEFRAIRAADMNYHHSTSYGRTYTNLSIWSSLAAGFMTVLGLYPDILKSEGIIKAISSVLASYLNILIVIIVMYLFFFIGCPKFLMPHYKEKEERHNNAGAAWQALEVKINAFLETMTTRKLTSDDIRNAIAEFAVERQEACKIACPEEDTYKEVTEDPKRCARRVYKRNMAYEIYKSYLGHLQNENS